MSTRALYYETDDVWKIEDNGNIVQEITIDNIPIDDIVFFCKKYDIISAGDGWEDISEDKRIEILEWFKDDVFSSEEYGEFFLKGINKEQEDLISGEGEIEEDLGRSKTIKEFDDEQRTGIEAAFNEEKESKITKVFKRYKKEGNLKHIFKKLRAGEDFYYNKLSDDSDIELDIVKMSRNDFPRLYFDVARDSSIEVSGASVAIFDIVQNYINGLTGSESDVVIDRLYQYDTESWNEFYSSLEELGGDAEEIYGITMDEYINKIIPVALQGKTNISQTKETGDIPPIIDNQDLLML